MPAALLNSLQDTIKALRKGGVPKGDAKFDAAGIAELRRQAGLSQAAFGERVGASERTVRSWESGVRQPGVTSRALLMQMREHAAQARQLEPA